MSIMDHQSGMFNVQQTVGSVLCCKCGVQMPPNAANMCVNCLRSEVDITKNLIGSKAERVCSSGIVGSRKSNRIKSNAVSEKKKKKAVFNLCNFKPLGVYQKSDYYKPETGFDYPFNVEKCLTGKDDLNQLVIRNGTLTRVLQINPTLKKSYRVYKSWDTDITGDAHWSPRGSYNFEIW